MPRESQEHFLTDLLGLLRRQRLLIFASALLALGGGVAYVLLKSPTYVAGAEIGFNDIGEDLRALGTPASLPLDPASGAAADAEVITSSTVVNRVAASVGSDLSKAEILDSVETTVNPDNNLVTIQATAASGQLAARIANSLARETRLFVTSRDRTRLRQAADRLSKSSDGDDESLTESITQERIAALRSLATVARPVVVATQARAPEIPDSPRPLRASSLALALGLIFGLLAAFLRDSLDRRLRDAHDVQHHLQIPLLGYVGAESLGHVALNQNGNGNGEEGIERFRILRSNLDFLAPGQDMRVVAITSPLPEEGKSTVAAGLAAASALAGKRTLLVECDLRRPVLAERCDVPAEPGLCDWIAGRASPADVLQHVAVENHPDSESPAQIQVETTAHTMDLVVAGTSAPRPTEFLGSPQFKEFLAQVREGYDLVVLDCAPLLPVGDTLEVIPEADAALICIRLDRTTQEQALMAKAAVEHFPARPTAIVVTGARPGHPAYHYYYGYYGPPSASS